MRLGVKSGNWTGGLNIFVTGEQTATVGKATPFRSTFGSSPIAEYFTASLDECSGRKSCLSCAQGLGCGWCNGVCVAGDAAGPVNAGTCSAPAPAHRGLQAQSAPIGTKHRHRALQLLSSCVDQHTACPTLKANFDAAGESCFKGDMADCAIASLWPWFGMDTRRRPGRLERGRLLLKARCSRGPWTWFLATTSGYIWLYYSLSICLVSSIAFVIHAKIKNVGRIMKILA